MISGRGARVAAALALVLGMTIGVSGAAPRAQATPPAAPLLALALRGDIYVAGARSLPLVAMDGCGLAQYTWLAGSAWLAAVVACRAHPGQPTNIFTLLTVQLSNGRLYHLLGVLDPNPDEDTLHIGPTYLCWLCA